MARMGERISYVRSSFRFRFQISVFTPIGGQSVSVAGQNEKLLKLFFPDHADRWCVCETAGCGTEGAEAAVTASSAGRNEDVLFNEASERAENGVRLSIHRGCAF